MLHPDTYELLRTLTSPVVAVTSRRGPKLNGMVCDGAVRASIVPDIPRVGVFIHKFNYSHELIFETGVFAAHLLHAGQVDIVMKLGFASGRDRDKLTDIPHRVGETGCPLLEDCFAWFDCRVCNAMDTGSSTFFMGDVVASGRGPGGEVLEPVALRDALPQDLMVNYGARLKDAQDRARALSRTIRPLIWRDLTV